MYFNISVVYFPSDYHVFRPSVPPPHRVDAAALGTQETKSERGNSLYSLDALSLPLSVSLVKKTTLEREFQALFSLELRV